MKSERNGKQRKAHTRRDTMTIESPETCGSAVVCSDWLGAWVDVNERRPDKMCHVLCATDSGYVDVSFYDPTAKLDELKLGRKYCGKWGRYFDLCKRGYKITHWMPLPKAPNNQAEASGARGRPIANPDAPAALPPARG